MAQAPHAASIRRSSSKHLAILQSASALAQDIGYEKCTIEAVASLAGVGKQTIYRWWPSKADLYLEAYKFLVTDLDTPVQSSISCREVLQKFLCKLFRTYRSTAAGNILAGLIAECSCRQEVRDSLAQGLFLGRQSLLADPINEGIRTGELCESVDVDFAVEIIIALIWKRLLIEPARLTPGYAKQILSIALKGFKA